MSNEDIFFGGHPPPPPLAPTVNAPVVLYYKNNDDNEIRFSNVPDLDTMFGRVLYLKWRAEIWVVIIVTLAIAGIIFALVATGASLFRFCKDSMNRDYTLLTAAFVAPGVILTFIAVAPFITQAGETICILRIILPALGYACMYSMILGRLLALSSFYLCTHALLPSQRRVFCVQYMMFLVLFGIQLGVSATQYVFGRYYQFFTSPLLRYYDYHKHDTVDGGGEHVRQHLVQVEITRNSTSSYYYTDHPYRCNFTPAYMLIQLIYPMILVVLCLLFSINFAYRSVGGLLIGIVSGLSVIVWVVWCLVYAFLDTKWNDLCLCAGLLANGYVVLMGLLAGDSLVQLRNDRKRDRQRLGLVNWAQQRQQQAAGGSQQLHLPNFLLTNDFNYNPQNGIMPLDYYRYDHSGVSAVRANGDVVIAKLQPPPPPPQQQRPNNQATILHESNATLITTTSSDDSAENGANKNSTVKFLGARPISNSLNFTENALVDSDNSQQTTIEARRTVTPQPPKRKESSKKNNVNRVGHKSRETTTNGERKGSTSTTVSATTGSSSGSSDAERARNYKLSHAFDQSPTRFVPVTDVIKNSPLTTHKTASTMVSTTKVNEKQFSKSDADDDVDENGESRWGHRLNLSFPQAAENEAVSAVENAVSNLSPRTRMVANMARSAATKL